MSKKIKYFPSIEFVKQQKKLIRFIIIKEKTIKYMQGKKRKPGNCYGIVKGNLKLRTIEQSVNVSGVTDF